MLLRGTSKHQYCCMAANNSSSGKFEHLVTNNRSGRKSSDLRPGGAVSTFRCASCLHVSVQEELPTPRSDSSLEQSQSSMGESSSSCDAMAVMESINKKLIDVVAGKGTTTLECTIFRVPSHICRGREELFRPQIVAIGPYAHENDDQQIKKELQAMEVVKVQFLHDLKMQTSKGFLEACVRKLSDLELKTRKCYYQSFDKIDSSKFIEIMLLDGIFIIQYFMKWKKRDIFSTIGRVQWNFAMILHDLLLLENQIPFFVLQALFDLFVRYKTTTTFNTPELLTEVLDGFKELGEEGMEVQGTIGSKKIHHLLHLYHHCFTSKRSDHLDTNYGIPRLRNLLDIVLEHGSRSFSRLEAGPSFFHAPGSILSAIKLQEAGVEFKRKKTASSFLDVTFKNGILEIPFISIHDSMTYKFANLIALEQSTNVGRVMTSYAVLMDKIIDTPDDVEVLRYEGILENMLASNEDVALFFNQLCSHAHLDFQKHYLARVFRDVDAYCKLRWHEQRAWLVRNYFSNAWVFISLVAAVILLILTFLQTYFAIYAYFRPP